MAAEWPAWIDRLDFNVPGYGATDEFLAGVESFRMSVRAYTSGNMEAYRRGEWPKAAAGEAQSAPATTDDEATCAHVPNRLDGESCSVCGARGIHSAHIDSARTDIERAYLENTVWPDTTVGDTR